MSVINCQLIMCILVMLENIISPINECNKLSADCVHSSSINMFKNRIDNYLLRAGYT